MELKRDDAREMKRSPTIFRVMSARGIILVVSAIVVAGCGANAAPKPAASIARSLFGPFAGYNWSGPVKQVTALVVVPRILSSSPSGFAGTWIGATGAVDGKTLSAPFFQIGVNELRRSRGGQERSEYYAFWSSTAVGFHPRAIFRVHPGDAVRLTMTLAGGRWIMIASDQANGRSRTVAAPSGGKAFVLASWLQEDVAENNTGAQESYPVLGGVRFSEVAVNSSVPLARSMHATWMSTNRGTFGPTPVASRSFEVKAVHPSAAAVHYKEIAYDIDYAQVAYVHDLVSWTDHTRPREINAASTRFAHALQVNAKRFRDYKWPDEVQPLIGPFVAAMEKDRSRVLALATASPSELTRGRALYVRSDVQVAEKALRIKSRLHIPDSEFSGPAVVNYVRTHPG